ncbi:MAG: nucleotidyltransferase domain-containing protein [Elusimicrobia bacterium]|nr:nucleotidyltransferase domain-containing protein [Elusimicrobiota bacterium]
MEINQWLEKITQRIAGQIHPKKILLFGSRAYGRPSKDSDLDLLVILKKSLNKHKRYILVDKAIGEHIYPIDLLVRSEKEVEKRLAIGDCFFAEILKKGRTLYEG